jgi:RNAse (barnase) inhibitor barstar
MMPFDFQEQPQVAPDAKAVILPTNLKSKAELFTFLRKAVPLPDYFGDNWDALEECLADLSWLPDSKITLVHQDIPLEPDSSEQRTYLQILENVASESGLLQVVFPERCRHKIARLLSDEGKN